MHGLEETDNATGHSCLLICRGQLDSGFLANDAAAFTAGDDIILQDVSVGSANLDAGFFARDIVTGDDNQTQCVINCGALTRLLALLGSPKKGIRKEACWTISNMTAGTRDQIQAIIEASIIPPVIHLLSNAEFDIKKEAA